MKVLDIFSWLPAKEMSLEQLEKFFEEYFNGTYKGEYSQISQKLGISESTIKTYCRRHGLGSTEVKVTPGKAKNCICCGIPVMQTSGRKEKKFCSDKCRMQWWNSNLEKVSRKARGASTIKTVRGVLRPAFQMVVDDDMIVKNPFGFQLAGVIYNDEKTRQAITKEQMKKFLKFVHDDNVYCKYYEVFYILFHTGMRISEFCGLTLGKFETPLTIISLKG